MISTGISAGNDIVALERVNNLRTRQSKFYSKILSVQEQADYANEMPFERYVWLLWSVKESAYKFLKRVHPRLQFSPTRFIVQHLKAFDLTALKSCEWVSTANCEASYTGQVTYGEHVLFFRSRITEDWIASVVNENEAFENVWWGVKPIESAQYDVQSAAVRTFALNKLRSIYPSNLQIVMSDVGYPVVMSAGAVVNVPVSLAHDGKFVSYGFSVR